MDDKEVAYHLIYSLQIRPLVSVKADPSDRKYFTPSALLE